VNNLNDKNFGSSTIPITIYDMRGQEKSTNVDTTGFQAITSPSSVSSSLLLNGSQEEVERIYYPEVEALLKKHTGASRVVFFDHTIRKPRPEGVPDTPQTRSPVMLAHVDQTPLSSHKRVDRHVQPPQPYRRFQIINVWRPIENTVYDYPLAVCEAPTVDVLTDLVPTTLLYPPPTPNGETYSVQHNPNQVWWYWSEMKPDDVLLLKCYDSASRDLTRVKASAADVQESELKDVAGLTPHTAFFHAEGAKKGIERKSIEVRALVFYD
jgi:cephamycin C biosynthesis protein